MVRCYQSIFKANKPAGVQYSERLLAQLLQSEPVLKKKKKLNIIAFGPHSTSRRQSAPLF